MHFRSSASSTRAAAVSVALYCIGAAVSGCGSSATPAELDDDGPLGGDSLRDDDSGSQAQPGPSLAKGDSSSDGNVGAATPDASSPAASAGAIAYPAGPYGENNPDLAEVVENLSFRGLLNLDPPTLSASLDVAPLSFQAFRETDARYLLLITAMAWCGSCQAAARQLGGELLDRVTALREEGALVAQLLLQGGGSAQPTDAELLNWAQAGSLPVSVLGPVDDEAARVFPQREWMFVLRLDTMQVVWRQQVSLYATPTTSQLGVERLEALVAQ